jgi:hypothetical protein
MLSETQVLDAIYNATIVILESTPQVEIEQKTHAIYFQYNLCSCEVCKKECAAHINKKGQIRISQKYFQNTLKFTPPDGFLEVMYTILHQILHGIFPQLEEEAITEKTEQTWNIGIMEISKEKKTKTDFFE